MHQRIWMKNDENMNQNQNAKQTLLSHNRSAGLAKCSVALRMPGAASLGSLSERRLYEPLVATGKQAKQAKHVFV